MSEFIEDISDKYIKNIIDAKEGLFSFKKNEFKSQVKLTEIEVNKVIKDIRINDAILLIKEFIDDFIDIINKNKTLPNFDINLKILTEYVVTILGHVLKYYKTYQPTNFGEFKSVGKMADKDKIAMAFMIYHHGYTVPICDEILVSLDIEDRPHYGIKNVEKVLDVIIQNDLKPNSCINHYSYMCFNGDVIIKKKYAEYFIKHKNYEIAWQLDGVMLNKVLYKFIQVLGIVSIDIFNIGIELKNVQIIEYLFNNKLDPTDEMFDKIINNLGAYMDFCQNVIRLMVSCGYEISQINKLKLCLKCKESFLTEIGIENGSLDDDSCNKSIKYFNDELLNKTILATKRKTKKTSVVTKITNKLDYKDFNYDTLIYLMINAEKFQIIESIICEYVKNMKDLLPLCEFERVIKILNNNKIIFSVYSGKNPMYFSELINDKIDYTYDDSINYEFLIEIASKKLVATEFLIKLLENTNEIDKEIILKGLYDCSVKFDNLCYSILKEYIIENGFNLTTELLDYLNENKIVKYYLIDKLAVEFNIIISKNLFLESYDSNEYKSFYDFIGMNGDNLDDILLDLIKLNKLKKAKIIFSNMDKISKYLSKYLSTETIKLLTT